MSVTDNPRHPGWIAGGTALGMMGLVVSLLAYITLWADFGTTPELVPNISAAAFPMAMSLLAALVIGVGGYLDSVQSAVVGSALFTVVLALGMLDTFLVFGLPVGEEVLVVIGMGLVAILTAGIAYWEHRSNHMYL